MARGSLRIYLGAAPGVGKTFAMLNEGWRRHERGTDVVVGLRRDPQPASHRRAGPRPRGRSRGPRSTTAARRSRRWTSTPSSPATPRWRSSTSWPTPTCRARRNEKRWQDVEELLDAGHRRHLHGEHPAPRVAQRRRRGDHRHPPAGDDPRRGRPGGRADRAGRLHARGAAPADGPRQHLRARQGRRRARQLLPHRATSPPSASWPCSGWPTASTSRSRTTASGTASRRRGRRASAWRWPSPVRPATTTSSGGRRASRSRAKGDLIGVHVRADDGLATPGAARWSSTASSLEELGGTYREVVGSDVAKALVQAARAEGATQLVLGASRRSRWDELTRGSIIGGIIREAGRALDVHVISANDDGDAPSASRCRRSGCGSPRCRGAASSPACCSPSSGCPLLTLVLTPFRDELGFTERGVLLPDRWWWPSPPSAASGRPCSPRVAGFALPQLVLRRTHPHVHDPQRARPRRRRRLPARRRRREHARRRGRPGDRPRPTGRGARPRRWPAWPGRCCARAIRSPSCSPTWSRCSGSTTRPWCAPTPTLEVVAEAGAGAGGRRRRRSRSRSTEGVELRLAGPDLRGADREVLGRLRRPARRRPREPAAPGGGGRGRGADAGQRAAHGPARGRQPRPAHAAGVDQGVVVEPAVRRRVVHRRAGPSPAGDDRRGGRPAQRPGGEPARHEPHPDRRPRGEAPGGRPRRGDRRRAERPARPRPRHPPRRVRDAPGRRRRSRCSSNGPSPTSSTTRCGSRRRASRCASRPARSPAASTCASSTPVPASRRDAREDVFRPFQRLGDSPNGTGVGLGLAVARGFVVAMGGELTAEDTPGGGTTMVLSLPEADPVTRLLVIDDEVRFAKALAISLRAHGYEVDVAEHRARRGWPPPPATTPTSSSSTSASRAWTASTCSAACGRGRRCR